MAGQISDMMATERELFAGFDPYQMTGIRVTNQKLGHGSYATVIELEYMGLKCAGKKIHKQLLEQGEAGYTIHRFEEECRLLSQVRHPNIVQFLGVYFQEEVQVPTLVMEFLPITLTSCIEQHGMKLATPSCTMWLLAYSISTAKLLPLFTEISPPIMSSLPLTWQPKSRIWVWQGSLI